MRTFSTGGVEPPLYKHLIGREVRNAILPSIAVVPFLQHAGKETECLVSAGDRVREGQVIGRSRDPLSANVHSPIPGTVIELRKVLLPEGGASGAAVIELGGSFDRLGKRPEKYLWHTMTVADLIRTIADKGVVGLDGDGIPVHARLSQDRAGKIETLIVNAVESEPYASADYGLLVNRASEVVEGLRILSKVLAPRNRAICVCGDRSEGIDALRKAVDEAKEPIEIVAMEPRYPQGDELLLIEALTGVVVSAGSDPMDSGFAVFNAATMAAVSDAIVLGKPLLERYVTVSGDAIRHPATLKTRFGTPIGDLISECGGFVGRLNKVVVNGPFRGSCVYDLRTPVTKRTAAVLALSEKAVNAARNTACVNCGRCVRACPVGLNPARLRRLLMHRLFREAVDEGLDECRECAACAYICPARLPLVQVFREGKAATGKDA